MKACPLNESKAILNAKSRLVAGAVVLRIRACISDILLKQSCDILEWLNKRLTSHKLDY